MTKQKMILATVVAMRIGNKNLPGSVIADCVFVGDALLKVSGVGAGVVEST
jgi:hypothetical protein